MVVKGNAAQHAEQQIKGDERHSAGRDNLTATRSLYSAPACHAHDGPDADSRPDRPAMPPVREIEQEALQLVKAAHAYRNETEGIDAQREIMNRGYDPI